MRRRPLLSFLLGVVFVLLVMSGAALAQDDEFVFGVVLVGPQNDSGWSQAHFEGAEYVEEQIPGARKVVFESLNTTDTPGATLLDVVTEMVDQGAQVIFTTSDSFEEDTTVIASDFPNVIFINISGDDALTGDAPNNVGNLMGQMEWGKLIAGCAAGLATETGNIGYVGPLINNETRRLSSSAYLGARECYERAGGNPDNLTFTVTWIGFWFNIPGVTLDPREVTGSFYDNGADVVISGIDTTEVIQVADQRAQQGEVVYAIPYDYQNACDLGPEVCLGVPYFHWGPAYTEIIRRIQAGTWEQDWEWLGPNWADLNDPDASTIGFMPGDALADDDAEILNGFIAELGAYATNPMTPTNQFGIRSIALWEGPLNLQDESELAGPGQLVDPLDIWYLPQLLDGMTGASESE